MKVLWLYFAFFLLTSRPAFGYYGLQRHYEGNDFFNQFWFFTDNDPTGGYVNYVDRSTAEAEGLISVNGGRAIIKADSLKVPAAGSRGRDSVRLTSYQTFDEGLWVFSLNHMPSGCGTWPAFWTVGWTQSEPWPTLGEIDIIEGANRQTAGHNALHTANGCTMNKADDSRQAGIWSRSENGNEARNCFAYFDNWNVGCARDALEDSYGEALNKMGGGYYVMELDRSQYIRIWFFTNDEVPSDIRRGSPNPDLWSKKPISWFPLGSNCNGFSFFRLQAVVINLTFCGGWAGYGFQRPECPGSGISDCNNYVRNNPGVFKDAYWDINYLRVYQRNSGSAGVPEPPFMPTVVTSTTTRTTTTIRTTTATTTTRTTTATTTRTTTATTTTTTTPTQSTKCKYGLQSDFQGNNFFDSNNFNFFTGDGKGYVNYVNKATAISKGLVAVESGRTTIKADSTNRVADGARGRDSVFLASTAAFNEGLWLFSFNHMPTGCGTWPTFSTIGATAANPWPENGEIGIMEGVNVQSAAHTSLHTTSGCTMDGIDDTRHSGSWSQAENGNEARNCYAFDSSWNTGCSRDGSTGSFGEPVNIAGGGYYVMELDRSQFVRIWWFNKTEVPADIQSGNPNPDGWTKKPISWYALGTNCNGTTHFQKQTVNIDLSFCGGWAGPLFGSQCRSIPSDCNTYVKNNPEAFVEAYWDINYLRIYQKGSGACGVPEPAFMMGDKSQCPYGLKSDFRGSSFLNTTVFAFFTGNDPNNGYVNYVDQNTAVANGLVKISQGRAVIRADTSGTVPLGARGRDSVFLSSMDAYDEGLWIFSFNHVPSGCGTWASLSTSGSNWPQDGEIGIMEGVNEQTKGHTSMHTSNGCSMAGIDEPWQEGTWSLLADGGEARNCYAFADSWNTGCSRDGSEASFGAPVNAAGGGYYIMELDRSKFVRIWWFSKNEVPADIQSGSPNPNGWTKKPISWYTLGSNCNGATHFQKQTVKIFLSFCGGWAGSLFGYQCPSIHSDCNTFVRENPQALVEAYWDINYLRIYQRSSGTCGVPETRPKSQRRLLRPRRPDVLPPNEETSNESCEERE